MFIILCSDFRIYSSVLSTKSLISLYYHSVDHLNSFHPYLLPLPFSWPLCFVWFFTYFEVFKKIPI